MQDLRQLLGPLFPNRPLAVLHLGDVALRNARQLGELALGDALFAAGGAQHATLQLGIGERGKHLAPGDRIAGICFCKP